MIKIFKNIALVSIYLVPLFPLVVISVFIFPFITGPTLYFRSLVEITFVTWLILSFLDRSYRPKITPIFMAILIFICITFISDLLGVNFAFSYWSNFDRMQGWVLTIHLLAFFLIMTGMSSSLIGEYRKKFWNNWFRISLVTAAIISIYGFFQNIGFTQSHFDGVRIDAVFGHPTFFAGYLLFHIFIAAYLLIERWKSKNQFTFISCTYVILALLFTFDLFKTGTRGSFLGLIIGLGTTLILYSVFGKYKKNTIRLFTIVLLFLTLGLMMLFWFNRDKGFINSNPILNRFASISWTASDQSRQYIWPAAIKGISERPILGWGQENFGYSFQKYYDPAMFEREQWVDRAHNIFLDKLIEGGIVGLISYIAILLILIVVLWRSSIVISQKSLLTGLIVGYIIHNLFIFDSLSTLVFFFAILAFVDTYGQSKTIKILDIDIISEEKVKYICLPLVVSIFILILYYVNIRPLISNWSLSLADAECSKNIPSTALFERSVSFGGNIAGEDVLEQLIPCTWTILDNSAVSAQIKQSFIDFTLALLEKQMNVDKNNAYLFYISGPFYKHLEQYSKAENVLKKAHDLAPNEQVVDFELASVLLYESKYNDAISILKQAYESAPNFEKAATAYAAALLISGKEREAALVKGANQDKLNGIRSSIKSGSQINTLVMFHNITSETESYESLMQKAQVLFSSGDVNGSLQILNSIKVDYPLYEQQIDKAIEEVEIQKESYKY